MTCANISRLDVDLPCSIPAEQVVLGCLLESPALLPGLQAIGLSADDFMLSDHRRAFRAILDLRQQNVPVDVVSVAEQLGNATEDFGLLGTLISGVVVERAHAQHHCLIVRKKARLRTIMRIAEWLEGAAADLNADPKLVVAAAIGKLQGVKI